MEHIWQQDLIFGKELRQAAQIKIWPLWFSRQSVQVLVFEKRLETWPDRADSTEIDREYTCSLIQFDHFIFIYYHSLIQLLNARFITTLTFEMSDTYEPNS